MKNILNSILLVAVAASALASCSKKECPSREGTAVRFSLTAPQTGDDPQHDTPPGTENSPLNGAETRSRFGTAVDGKYPTLWTSGTQIALSYNYNTQKKASVTPSEDGKTAEFTAEFESDASASGHNFYSISPAGASVSITEKNGATIDIPSSQTPIDGSCDEAAQVTAAKYESSTFDTEISLPFKHVTAYGRLAVTMPSDAGDVSSISLTASENISGRYYYSFSESALTEYNPSKTITLTTSKTSDIFFACAPADLSGGSLTLTVTATGGVYEKTLDLSGKTLKFVAGEVSKFGVNMSDVTPTGDVAYTLVTDAATLKVGDKVIIAACDYDVAISTIQNTSNRGAAAVTKSSDKSTITNPGATVQIFTLESGNTTSDGTKTCAFNTGSGYIYASSNSANELKTRDSINDYASWTVSCAEGGETTISAQGGRTRNLLQYYNTASKSLFSCYDSSNTQKAVALYTDGKGDGACPF